MIKRGSESKEKTRCHDASSFTPIRKGRRPRGAKKETDRWDRQRSPHAK